MTILRLDADQNITLNGPVFLYSNKKPDCAVSFSMWIRGHLMCLR